MLINLAFSYLEDQNNIEVSRTYTILPSDTPVYGNKQQLIAGLTRKTNKDGDSNAKESSLPLTNPAELLSRLSMDNISGDHEIGDMTLSSLLTPADSKKSAAQKPVLVEDVTKETIEPVHSLSVTPGENGSDNSSVVTLTVKLPGISSVSECELDISSVSKAMCASVNTLIY